MQKTEGNETTKYFYSGTALFYTTNGWGTLTTENILDLGGQIVASKRFPDPDEVGSPFANKYFFYNYDIRGSVTNIVGPDGNLVTGYGYDEFGNQERKGDTSFLNEVTFTGSISDTSTGLQYMNARFYQPTTGRFLSQDSYTGNAYDPWTQNLYSYCGNNPTNFVDPTGHSALVIAKKLSATIDKLAALRKDRAKCVIPPYVSNDVANRIKERAKNLDIMIHSTDIYRRTLYGQLADENKKKPAGPIHPAKPKEEAKEEPKNPLTFLDRQYDTSLPTPAPSPNPNDKLAVYEDQRALFGWNPSYPVDQRIRVYYTQYGDIKSINCISCHIHTYLSNKNYDGIVLEVFQINSITVGKKTYKGADLFEEKGPQMYHPSSRFDDKYIYFNNDLLLFKGDKINIVFNYSTRVATDAADLPFPYGGGDVSIIFP